MNKLLSLLACIFLVAPAALAQTSDLKASPEIVVHLLDYLAKDYGGAVQNGKVVSESEYAEQVEFAGIVGKNARGVQQLNEANFEKGLGELEALIKAKGSADEVANLARKLQADAIRLAKIEVAPTEIADLALGKKLFQQNCTSCHGSDGHGDGPAGKGLDPVPADFHDAERIWTSAPYKFYNTIRLGVPGTGMAAYASLSDHEVWSLAYYLKAMPYEGKTMAASSIEAVSATEVATMTDSEIAQRLGLKRDDSAAVLALVRLKGPSSGAGGDPLGLAESLMQKSVDAAKSGDFEQAQTHALNAYLQGIEPIEPKMRANLPGFVEQIESMMASYRSSLSKKDDGAVLESKRLEIIAKLKDARTQFSETKMSPGVAFGAAFSIFLREGFEAVLIIVVLLSILRAMNQPQAVHWVHVGWISAVVVGVIGWFLSGALLAMSGLSRELMEGSISLLAVVVLVYVGFWLHRYTEMKKWRAFLESKLKHGLHAGSYFGLAVVSFLAVFREAFEVVLFLRAIWIDLDPSGQSIAGLGVLSSLALLLVLSYFAVKQSRKLPLGKLFQVCSWTMMVLAVVLAGKGTHALQEAGFVPVTSLPVPLRLDLLGLYPSYQTILLQLAVIALFAFLLLNDRKQAHAEHDTGVTRSA